MLKRLLRHPALLSALTALLARYLAWTLATTRWTLIGAEHFAPFEAGAPVIAAFWHEHLPLMPALWNRARKATPGLKLYVLVSRHTDGRFIADVISRFGLSAAYGSTARAGRERGGAAGALTLLAALQNGHQVVITPDGPRGPRRVAAPGVAQLAGLAGQPVLPCAARTKPCHILPSWDRMILPLPFARGVLVCGPAIQVPRDDAASLLPAISLALNQVAEEAQKRCR